MSDAPKTGLQSGLHFFKNCIPDLGVSGIQKVKMYRLKLQYCQDPL